jgi:hypothetical protein
VKPWNVGLKTIHVLCAPCLRDGNRHKLATFDLGPDGPAVWGWTAGGKRVVPLWTGPEGEDKVHLKCGHGHTPQRKRQWIIELLDAAPEGVSTIAL